MSVRRECVDLQINGYAGVDFNSDAVGIDDLHRACAALDELGVAGILATVITDSIEAMARRLARLAEARRRDALARRLIWGFHVEGPFISAQPGYVGAHRAEAVRPADVEAMNRLLEAGEGLVRIVTLAPECDPGGRLTRHLADQGIRVAAGHCNPSLDQLRAAIDCGLTLFTHLGNACPARLERHDNILQRALALREHLTYTLIADGIHLPYFVLGNFLASIGLERAAIISDAIAAAGAEEGAGVPTLGGEPVVVDERGASRRSGGAANLAGSTVSLPHAAENLRRELGLDESAIRRLTLTNPARLARAADEPPVEK